jgi:hypothetical protein
VGLAFRRVFHARWSKEQRPFLAVAATPAPTVVSAVGVSRETFGGEISDPP